MEDFLLFHPLCIFNADAVIVGGKDEFYFLVTVYLPEGLDYPFLMQFNAINYSFETCRCRYFGRSLAFHHKNGIITDGNHIHLFVVTFSFTPFYNKVFVSIEASKSKIIEHSPDFILKCRSYFFLLLKSDRCLFSYKFSPTLLFQNFSFIEGHRTFFMSLSP